MKKHNGFIYTTRRFIENENNKNLFFYCLLKLGIDVVKLEEITDKNIIKYTISGKSLSCSSKRKYHVELMRNIEKDLVKFDLIDSIKRKIIESITVNTTEIFRSYSWSNNETI